MSRNTRTKEAVSLELQKFVEALVSPAFVLSKAGQIVFANAAGNLLLDQHDKERFEKLLASGRTIDLPSGDVANVHQVSTGEHAVVLLEISVRTRLSDQARLLDIFDRAGLATVVLDAELRIRHISHASQLIATPSEVLGKKLTEAFEVRPEILEFFRQTIASGERAIWRAFKPADPRLPRSLNVTALPIGEELLVVYEDNELLEHHREESELSVARFRALGDSLSVALLMIDQDLTITFWNRKAAELTRLDGASALGRSAREIFPFIDGGLSEGLQHALRTHSEFTQDRVRYEYRHISGYFNVKANPVGKELAILIEDVTSTVRVEELIRANKERFRRMSDGLSLAFVLLDRNNRVTFWNRACELASGIPASKALGAEAVEVLPFTSDRIAQLCAGAIDHPEGIRHRVEPEREGVKATYDVRAFQIDEELGVLLEDVTQQVQRATELAQTNKLFLDLYENAPCGYMTVQASGEIDQINRTMREWLELTTDGPIRNVQQLLTEESQTRLEDLLAHAPSHTALQNLELEFVRSSRTTLWGLTTALPIFDEVRQSWYWRWTVVDITAHRKVQSELEDIWLFNQLFNELGEAVLISDKSGQIIRANQAASRILGISIDELTRLTHQDPLWHAVREDGTPVPIDQLPGVRALREQAPVTNLELGVVRGDGTLTWILESAAPLFDRDGNISGVIVTFPEVTATVMQRQTLKDLNEKYQIERDRANEANRLKSSFLANMSHEIRTPMTAILGFSDILATELSGKVSEQHYTFLRSINVSGKRLLNLINDILDLSKIEAGRLDLHLEELHIGQEIESAVTPLTWIAKQKGLPIVLELAAGDLVVRGDRQRFAQVMTNIISNAIKFTRSGSIHVRTFITQDEALGDAPTVNIEVEDTGIGISREFLPHLFEEFRQEHTGATKEFGGTGLGLAISRRLIAMMNGRIHLRSQQGVGTAFTLQFPLIAGGSRSFRRNGQAVMQSPPQSGSSRETTAEERKLVLVVEDNQETQRLLEVYLKNTYRVAQAFNAVEAIAAMQKEAPDAILMDVNLPGKDGLTLTREIRSGDICPHVAIVALTAFAMTGDRQRCLAAGCNDYLSKPATKREVLEKIELMLRETSTTAKGV